MEKEVWYRYDCQGKTPAEISAVQETVEKFAEHAPHGEKITLFWNNQVNAFFLQTSSSMEELHKLGFHWINQVEEGDVNLLVLERLWENY